ncbi:MAG: lysophospholipid acyltransferase family protein [Bacilli bacterium]
MKPSKVRHVKPRHQRYVSVAGFILGPFIRLILGYKSPRIKVKQYEPFLVVSNHVTAFDPILLTMTFGRQVYYVSSELIFSKGLISRMLEHTFAPIPKSKSQTDITSVKSMIQVVKEGGNVGVFVEGNSTINGAISNVPAAIGKLVLLLKIPLIIFNFDGGYLSNPRWASAKRKRHIRGHIRQVLTYDEYKHLTAEELNDLIIKGINVNAYEESPVYTYDGKHNAEGLHRLLFACPKCQAVNTIKTINDTYSCLNCGFKMTYDNHGYLHSSEFSNPKNTVELDLDNKIHYQETVLNNPDFTIRVRAKMSEVFRRRRKHFGMATLSLSREGLTIDFHRKHLKTLTYSLDELDTMAMQQKEVLVIYPKNEQTKMALIANAESVSAYQLMVTLQILKNERNYLSKGEALIKLTATEIGL